MRTGSERSNRTPFRSSGLMHTLLQAAILALATLGTTPAPSPSPSAPPIIETVRVATGLRESLHAIPVAASVLDATTIARTPALATDDLLRTLPGFDRTRSNSAFTNYGQLRASFSGAGTDRGLVLVNGVPAQDGFGGQIDWAAYPPGDITRAELLRGAGSALYGPGGVGGVLRLDTLAPPAAHQAPHATFALSAGSHDASNAFATTSASLGRAFALSLALAHATLAYRDLAPGYQSPIDAPAYSTSSMASLRLRYTLRPGSQFAYGYRGAWDMQDEGRPNYDFQRGFAQQRVRFRRVSARASLAATVYDQAESITNRADTFPQRPGYLRYLQSVPSHDNGIGIAWRVRNAATTFELRSDLRTTSGTSTQYGPTGMLQSSGSGVQSNAGLALQERLRARRFEVVGGVRGDVSSFTRGVSASGPARTPVAPAIARALSPRLALRFTATSHLALRISEGSGIRTPYLNELLRGYQIGPVFYLPNPSLVPERSRTLSAGIDGTWKRTHLALDAIHTVVNDAIMFRTIDATHQIRSNVARTQTDGITAVLTRTTGVTRISGNVTSQYASVVCCDVRLSGKRLAYVPAVSANLTADAPMGPGDVGLTLAYLGQAFADDLNEQPLGTAVLLGVHATVRLRAHVFATLNVTNLTGAHYLSSIDRYAPPSVVELGISYR